MSTIELRKIVLQKLETAEDHLLEEILGIIELKNAEKSVLKIPEEHKRNIELGLAQIDAGQTVANQEVNKRVQQWLGK